MKIKEVAKIEGVSTSYVSKIANGKKDASSIKAQRILQWLSINEEDLFELISDELFLEVCNVAIQRAKRVEVRRRAAILFELSLKLQRGRQ